MNDKIDDGGQAFPRAGSEDRTSGDMPDGNSYDHPKSGMSLRDYYIANNPIDFSIAVRAWGSRDGDVNFTDDQTRAGFFAVWALIRVEFADAMIKARKR